MEYTISECNGRQFVYEEVRSAPLSGLRWRLQLTSLAFLAFDFSAVAISYLLASIIYSSSIFASIRHRIVWDSTYFVQLGFGMAILLLFFFGMLGLYRRGASILNVQEDVLILKGLALNSMAALTISFLVQDHFPRIALILAMILAVPLVMIGRGFFRRLCSWFLSAGVGSRPVVIYGAGDTGRQLADRLLRNPQLGLMPIGFIDDNISKLGDWVAFGPAGRRKLPLFGGGEEMLETMQEKNSLHLFIAMPKMNSERLHEIQITCAAAGITSYYVPLFLAGSLRRFSLSFVGDIPLVSERTAEQSFPSLISKRLFDIVISTFLLLTTSWVMLLVAIAIKWKSKGPVIFRQQRIGHNGKPFSIYKFRTMDVGAPAYAAKPTPGSSNITGLGRFLRKTSIDELPQLLNVLKGEMSLVGPRPDMPQVVAEYNPVQRERLMAIPGMTGLWQVSRDRSSPIHENIDYDLFYLYNRSILLDIVILARTAFCFFNGH
ncbi:MAG: sugar transferase [Planctomycetes bacterium]|nr:sugar transferase [Planctomycetota bacterium]